MILLFIALTLPTLSVSLEMKAWFFIEVIYAFSQLFIFLSQIDVAEAVLFELSHQF